MRVAIVDDEQRVREQLREYVGRFAAESGLEMQTELFSSGDQFMQDYRMVYDICIFDIDMPGTNGMDTARKLRKMDKNVTIIFVTNFVQYAINGYEVEAVDYIIKPVGYYDFSMKFYRTVEKAAQKQDRIYVIQTSEGARRLHVNDIIYIEVLSHYLYFHTEKSVYKARGSMNQLEAELMPYFFVRIHRAYLINLKYLENILAKEVVVNGTLFPLGRNYKDLVKQEYMKYIRGEK